MAATIHYVVFHESDTIVCLGRIFEDGGLWGERLVDGKWVRDDRAVQALCNIDGWVELIDDDEAEALASRMGIELDH